MYGCGNRVTKEACPVFPGIELVYRDGTAGGAAEGTIGYGSGGLMGICHCREGRMEWEDSGGFRYAEQGDLLIARLGGGFRDCRFPEGRYRGISVLLDVDRAPRCLSCYLEDVAVCPRALERKFCSGRDCCIVRANPSVEHIFSEMYAVPEEIRKGYLKIKVLEVLLFLSALDVGQEGTGQRTVTKSQADLARQVECYLVSHMESRVTLEQLAGRFHVSETYIRSCFKNVYGVSVGSFIRARKMESAASMLEHTDKSVLEIAGIHGYDNGSKFAGAFREVMGMTPKDYRSLRCCGKV